MSDVVIGSNTRVCCTCDYWVGDRQPKMGGFSVVRNPDGKCYLINPEGIPKKSMYSCGQWKKWGALK